MKMRFNGSWLAIVLLLSLWTGALAIEGSSSSGETAGAAVLNEAGPQGAVPELQGSTVAGDIIPCEQLVYFKADTPSVDAGIASVVQHLSQSAVGAAAVGAEGGLPILEVFGRSQQPWGQPWQGPEHATVAAASATDKQYIKAILLKVCDSDPNSKELLQGVSDAPAVNLVVPNAIVRTSSDYGNCMSASSLSGVTRQVSPGTKWRGCLRQGLSLAWWGRRCEQRPDLTEWMGVYAYDSRTGTRVERCTKERSGSKADDDLWFGSCGVPPQVSPNTPSDSCRPPPTSCLPYSKPSVSSFRPTYSYNVTMVHPDYRCGRGQPVRMTYFGENCRSTDWGVNLVIWNSAMPVAGQDLPDDCSIYRSQKKDCHWDREWFGSCGVPPHRVRQLPTCADASPPVTSSPPPPPPSPPPPSPPSPPPPKPPSSPPPKPPSPPPPSPPPPSPPPPPPPPPPSRWPPTEQLVLEPIKAGETVPPSIQRVSLGAPGGQVPAESNWENPNLPAAVAVVDSGIWCEHPDLNVVSNLTVRPGQDACVDDYGHGTHVAGIVGARNQGWGLFGAAPGVPLHAIQVLNGQGTGSIANIIAGLNAIVAYTPPADKPYWAPRVVTLSLTWTRSSSNVTAIMVECASVTAAVQAQGIMLVAAAGNVGNPYNGPFADRWTLPAVCPGVMATTAIQSGPEPNPEVDTAAKFDSNLATNNGYSQEQETRQKTIASPGLNINSTMDPYSFFAFNSFYCPPPPNGGPNLFCRISGTSQAAPVVAGMYVRCYATGGCTTSMNATTLLQQIVVRNADYNRRNRGYGFNKDPIRFPWIDNIQYYGFLIYGGLF